MGRITLKDALDSTACAVRVLVHEEYDADPECKHQYTMACGAWEFYGQPEKIKLRLVQSRLLDGNALLELPVTINNSGTPVGAVPVELHVEWPRKREEKGERKK